MVTEVEHADGILRLGETALELEVELTYEETVTGAGKIAAATESLGTRDLEIALDQVVSVTVVGGWLWPRVRIATGSLRPLEDLPSAKQGRVDLLIRRRDLAAAQELVTELEMRHADLQLRHARASRRRTTRSSRAGRSERYARGHL